MRIRLNWEQELRYYEHRLEVLRTLEDQGELKSFSVSGELVTASVSPSVGCVFASNHFEVSATLGGSGDHVRALIALLVATIKPRVIVRLAASFQHVVPIEKSYDDARFSGARSLLAAFPDVVEDYALLMDAQMPGGEGKYKIEFGVVEAGDIQRRLRQEVGRMEGVTEASSVLKLGIKRADFPPVALFADSVWFAAGEAPSADPASAVLAFLDAAESDARRVVAHLHLLHLGQGVPV